MATEQIGWFVALMNMKNIVKMKVTAVGTTLLLAASLWVSAGEAGKQKQGSPEFERMKTLVGTWEGKTDMGQSPIDMKVQYRLLAAGSVVEERIFTDTPNEMVTMYFDKNGKLALTHYCMMGNRPAMLLKEEDAKTLKFDFDISCGINPKKESHMHSFSITFDDPNTITTSCKAIIDGKEMAEHPTVLKRVKS